MRPRLVEEGKPIPQHFDNQCHTIGKNGAGDENERGNTKDNPAASLSSLSRLAMKNPKGTNRNINQRNYKLETSIQIGGSKAPSEAMDEDQEMTFSGHEFQTNNTSSFTAVKQQYSLNTNIEIGRKSNCTDVDESMDVDCSHIDEHPKYTTNHSLSTENHEKIPLVYTAPSRMEIDDTLAKSPLVVIDGPNVAHAYAKVLHANSSLSATLSDKYIEPDVRGLQIASAYFVNAGCRVQIVIPAYWLRRKPRNGNNNSENTLMITEQVEILRHLQSQNLILCTPPTDDDDAYAIAVARREDARSQNRYSPQLQSLKLDTFTSCNVLSICGAFILSNDLFRDAIQRDGCDLQHWLRGKGPDKCESLPGRISYSFCDIGCMELDLIANPR